MKIKPIEINIDDERHFTDVALVVDQEEFKQEIEYIRDEYNIDDLLTRVEFRDFRRKIYNTEKEKKFNGAIERARTNPKLLLPIVFREVIRKAAFCGVIENDDYSPAYLDYELSAFDKYGNIPDFTYYIVLSPVVRDEDVIKVLQEYRDQLGNLKGIPYYEYIPQVRTIEKGKPGVKNHRQWYWLEQQGKSTKEICGDTSDSCSYHKTHEMRFYKKRPKGCTCYSQSTVRKGIKNYKSLLRKSRVL